MHAFDRLKVLLIEDQELDRMMVERAFRKSDVLVDLRVARDGVEALDVLRGSEGCAPLEAPYLILLDLNMPHMDGVEFLVHLRSDPRLKGSIVFVLTTSYHEADLLACYDHGIAGFFLKESLGEKSDALVRLVDEYWKLVELPS